MVSTRHRKQLFIILYPLSLIYGLIVRMRNRLFDWGILRQQAFPFPVICIGNLTVGGTGKTPHTEYLISFLKSEGVIAVLSRGYGRSTKGFLLASEKVSPKTFGDEPFQMYSKYSDVIFAVDENRVHGIETLQQLYPDLKAVILDDAYQHRYVKPGVSVLLIDYTRPVFSDHMLPYGSLRDTRSQIHRADIVIVTKVPEDIKPIEKRIWMKKLNLFPYQQLYFSSFEYAEPMPLWDTIQKTYTWEQLSASEVQVLLVTAIANPDPLKHYIEKQQLKVHACYFADHHAYTAKDMEFIQKKFDAIKSRKKILLTTQKDAVKFMAMENFPERLAKKLYQVGIRVHILDSKKTEFEKQLTKYVKKNKKIGRLYS